MKSKFLLLVQKNIHCITLFLLCMILTLTSQSQLSLTDSEIENIYFETGKTDTKYNVLKQRYNIIINTTLPNYIEVDVKSKDGNSGQYIYFSSYDQSCMSGREQLSQGVGSQTKMYIKKEQIKNYYFYLVVECKLNSTCSFTMTLTEVENINLSDQEQYTYYVSEKNKEMVFYINRKSDFQFSTFYAHGYKNINIKENVLSKGFENGLAIQLTRDQTITVIGDEGDLITVGVRYVKKTGNQYEVMNGLTPNRYSTHGLLMKYGNNEECYIINENENEGSLYIEGTFYEGAGKIYFRDNNFEENGNSARDYSIENFYYEVPNYLSNKSKYTYICVSIPKEYFMDYLVYSIELYNKNKYISGMSNKIPLTLGKIYQKASNIGEFNYYSSFLIEKANKMSLSFKLIEGSGHAEMYIYECETYPKCEPRNLNEMAISHKTHITYSETYNNMKVNAAISPNQKILVAYCGKPYEDYNKPCSYEILINSESSIVSLIENLELEEKLISGKAREYHINFKNKKSISKVYIDIMIINGDIKTYINAENLKFSKYDVSNKITYIIPINETVNTGTNEISFDTFSLKDSYYSLRYRLIEGIEGTAAELLQTINPGINYITYLVPNTMSGRELIFINNIRYSDNKNFLVNFQSLNCKFEVSKTYQSSDEKIELVDEYGQDIIYANSSFYKNVFYSYTVSVTNANQTNITSKFCMLYISAYEITSKKDNEKIRREILISENIPQQVIFNSDLKVIRYLYPIAEMEDYINIILNFIDEAGYNFIFYFDSHQYRKYDIYSSTQIDFEPSNWKDHCKSEVCNLIIEIELISTLYEAEPMLEISVNMEESLPIYLPKNTYITSYFFGKRPMYFYTDIVGGEEGKIMINHYKGTGLLYARIDEVVDVVDEDKEKRNAVWRNIDIFPKLKEQSLSYNDYLQQVQFSTSNTNHCYKNDCFLLITVNNLLEGKDNLPNIFYPFNIVVVSSFNLTMNYPIVSLPINEYIADNVLISSKDSENYNYFNVWLPYDSKEVHIELQTYYSNVLVNVGDSKPTIKNHHFSLKHNNEGDVIFKLSKEQILKYANYTNSLKNLNLTLGVWAEKDDMFLYSLYTLKVTLFRGDLEIHEVKSNQKSICLPTKESETEYRCLFFIFFDEYQYLHKLTIYPILSDKTATYHLYANYMSDEEYFDKSHLSEHIPKPNNAEISSDQKFLYANHGRLEEIFLSVILNKNTTVELVTSSYSFTKSYPVPSDEQLVALNEEQLELAFVTDKNIFIKCQFLIGRAAIYWKDHESNVIYINKEVSDTLVINRGYKKSDNTYFYPTLVIKNLNNNESDFYNPKLSFVYDYIIHPINIAHSEISSDKATLLHYEDVTFPFSLYSTIEYSDRDYCIILDLHNLVLPDSAKRYYVKGAVSNYYLSHDSYSTLEKLSESGIIGNFDGVTKTASLVLTKSYIQNTKNKNNIDNPTLYFSLNNELQDTNNTIIISALKAISYIISQNSLFEPLDRTYYYGTLTSSIKMVSYQLKIRHRRKYMRVQFNTNIEKCLEWSINSEKYNKKNLSFTDQENILYGGINSFFFKVPENTTLYLNIFRVDSCNWNPNYGFKYNGYGSKNRMNLYILNDNTVKVKKLNDQEKKKKYATHLIEIEPIALNRTYKNDTKVGISYLIKNIREPYKEEIKDTFAMTNSIKSVIEKENQTTNKNGKLEFFVNISDSRYITVIGNIKVNTSSEYVLYKGVDFEGKHRNFFKVADLVYYICCGLALLYVGAIALINKYKKTHGGDDLTEQIKKISFQQEDYKDPLVINDNDNNNVLE